MYYGDKQRSKINICHALIDKGWKIFGYKADQSDSMTDYYDPASWEGIATKDGYVLCVDVKGYELKQYSGKEVYEYKNLPINYTETMDKIKKLEEMKQSRGATAGEEENAKQLIEKLKQNLEDKEQEREQTKTLKYKIPTFQENPGRSNWHVEKDGKILDKGTGAFQFSRLPWFYDVWKEEFTGSKTWADGTKKVLREDEKQDVEKFKNFLTRINNIASGVAPMGDGTEETEAEGIEAEAKRGYEKVIEKVKKNVLKMVAVERDFFQVGDYITLSHHGHYWKITSEYMQKGTWKGVTESKKAFVYEIVGKESRGYKELKNPQRYYDFEFRMVKALAEGKTKIHELKEFEEIQEVEKWVKIDRNNGSNGSNKRESKPTNTDNKQEKTEQVNITHKYTITADIDTRDNSPLWVIKITDKLSREEYLKVAADFKKIKGYYSKFKKGFIFKYDPSEILGNIIEEKETEDNSYKQPEIEDNFLYDCHFKEWDLSMKEIQEQVKVLNIPFTDWVNKIGFHNITAEQARQLKEISDKNGSIFWIDKMIEIKEAVTA